ncbi:MAG: citrate lyase subunit beta / citryl-CoA lyase [Solirubrobacteraceae bacterium]|nr:citrate lyase subunit beta / citryl-CoA lyase [Solirubrobacteraceae bacterium]
MVPGPVPLFCPADRPERFEKALAAADAVILDLEDGVGPGRKEAARAAVRDALPSLPPGRTVVRINPPHTDEGRADLELLRASPLKTVMVPKAERAEALADLAPFEVVAICETAAGVLAAPALAAVPNCGAVMWGGEDLIADIGGRRSRRPDGSYLPVVVHARTAILLAAAAARTAAWDGVYLAIDDLDGLRAETEDAVAMGFAGKVAIHPAQVPVLRDAFAPSAEDVDWARAVIAASREAGDGVFRFRGRMVDGPLLTHARAIVAAGSARNEEAGR